MSLQEFNKASMKLKLIVCIFYIPFVVGCAAGPGIEQPHDQAPQVHRVCIERMMGSTPVMIRMCN